MEGDAPRHAIVLDLKTPVGEVDTLAVFVIPVTVESTSPCDLGGSPFQVLESGDVVAAGDLPALVRYDPDSHDVDPRERHFDRRDAVEIPLTAPAQIGAFEWTLVIPAREIDGIAHREATLPIAFTTKAHGTSLAVWGNPSPVGMGETFVVNVGAKCSAGCELTGKEIEIRDDTGALVASGSLGRAPFEGTTALYWTAVEMTAPASEGQFDWPVTFAAPELQLPHGGASTRFSFVTVKAPEHRVSVEIVEGGAGGPIAQAQVRLGVYRTATDDAGMATFDVPAGEYRLFVSKTGYEVPERTLDVGANVTVQVEAEKLPEVDPDEFWQG